jgi:hypothetical protein
MEIAVIGKDLPPCPGFREPEVIVCKLNSSLRYHWFAFSSYREK